MLAVLLAMVIVWIVLGIIGFVVHGLIWLFVIACVLFVVTVLAGCRMAQRGDAALAAQQAAERQPACVAGRPRRRARALQPAGNPRRPQTR